MSITRMKMRICLLVVFVCFTTGISEKLLYEGDSCKTHRNEVGICVRINLCPFIEEVFKNNEQPINCGFVRTTPIVCCPKNETTHIYLSEKKCEFYNPQIYAATLGENAKIKEFPHMAALGYNKNNKKVWLCGGTLISENYVLTAAHCLYSLEFGSVKWIRLGLVDLTEPEDAIDSNFQNFEVIKTIKHPLYKPPLVYNDIGLLELNRNVLFGVFVKPACLYIKKTIPEGEKLFATGWGLTKVGGNQSNILQKVSLDLFSDEECDMNYDSVALKRKLKYGIIHEQQICAGGKTIGTDTCQGDSGGPLKIKDYIKSPSRFYIIGITSFGKSCGFVNVPGVYTRVSYYVSWIESIVWPNEM